MRAAASTSASTVAAERRWTGALRGVTWFLAEDFVMGWMRGASNMSERSYSKRSAAALANAIGDGWKSMRTHPRHRVPFAARTRARDTRPNPPRSTRRVRRRCVQMRPDARTGRVPLTPAEGSMQ
ncbi:hypothetical protein BGLA2_450008 [Burkholderia gladioli]|nr:hypothetical protein BGLA2_450008 [Burkholderia gladioli]